MIFRIPDKTKYSFGLAKKHEKENGGISFGGVFPYNSKQIRGLHPCRSDAIVLPCPEEALKHLTG